ncbi:class I SAM-dependent methyltransferase [Anabaena sp. UHCC 0399]|uniref:class I SAM-dependent methyltransferase n=1 Tax=Anabaena sp. UHCC 0399 TaxID=3110238 RepID=UPI002B1E91F7|nr:methyltransferase domain-containing protein [Anabaena sp. UHCC 0399]MEA5567286.1 methyltransferase domain-containing protein [Anabaena sp. UHCC 0399]
MNNLMNNFVKSQNYWNAAFYENQHNFVWQYGADLLQLLNPQPGELILDLGCGTGQLTEKIAQLGANIRGIDSAVTMIEKARQNYPHLPFDVADARNFLVEQPLDAVFSNAALHWIKPPETATRCIYQALKPGGRFVAEFGGKGNISAIITALYLGLTANGISQPQILNPWYFPSIGEYVTILEAQGFDVIYATLFNRPTPLSETEAGLANWIRMFANDFFIGLSSEQKTQVIYEVENSLQEQLYHQGIWTIDYRRIRIIAIRI